jgi:hypothetical protein
VGHVIVALRARRSGLLAAAALAVISACDAGEKPAPKPEPAKAKVVDCATAVAALRASADKAGVHPVDGQLQTLEGECENDPWPQAFKDCVAAATTRGIEDCAKLHGKVLDELLLLNLETALKSPTR